MKLAVILFALTINPQLAQAAPMKAYKCVSQSGLPTEFPVLLSGDTVRVASSMGSSRYFDLEQIPAADLTGWPVFDGGTYYRGGDDLWVILPKADSLEVIKPLENLPEGQRYLCVRTL